MTVAEKFRAALLVGESSGFWVETLGPLESPCWLWLGKTLRQRGGYGLLSRGHGRWIRAHRFALEVVNGPLGKLCALHRCDVPRCVRPSHLFAGTRADNTHDAKTKGRLRGGAKVPLRGEAHWRAKLTRERVWQIYDRRRAGETFRAIAESLGISPSLASAIYRGAVWKSEQWLR